MDSTLVARARRAAQQWKRTRVARALARFNGVSGSLLCGGIAYTALFSVFAGLTIGYTTLSYVLHGHPEALRSVLDTVDTAVPGLVDTGDGGALQPDQLVLSSGTVWANIVAGLVLLWSALSFVGGLRTAVRAVFGLLEAEQGFLGARLRDLLGFVVLMVAVLVSATLSVVASRFGTWVATTLHLGSVAGVVAPVGGIVLAGVVDVGVVVFVVRVLGGARPPWRDLLVGAVVVAVVLGVVQYLGTSVVAGAASKNVLLASFAVVVTLLAVVAFAARVLLLVVAWVADPPDPSAERPRIVEQPTG